MGDGSVDGGSHVVMRGQVPDGCHGRRRCARAVGAGRCAADVGKQTWDEINRVPNAIAQGAKAANFGWPCYEGAPRQASFDNLNVTICENLYNDGADPAKAPLFAYRHTPATVPGGACPIGGQAAVSGLEFVEGTRYGSQYAGALFFSDYARGCIFAMPAGPGGIPNAAQAVEVMPAGTPVDLELGRDGFLYYVDILGRIHRIVRNVGGGPPVAAPVANRTSGSLPLTVTFDARGSTDPDGTAGLAYDWDLDGNGTFEVTAGAPTRQRTYTAPRKVVDPRVRVRDTSGQSDIATVRIHAGYLPPTVQIAAPLATRKWGWARGWTSQPPRPPPTTVRCRRWRSSGACACCTARRAPPATSIR